MTQAYEREKVLKIIDSVLSRVRVVGGDAHATDISVDSIRRDLMDLHMIIENVRREIGATAPSEITGKHIPAATDELDAVIQATAEASGVIMDSCEAIENQMAGLPAASADSIQGAITRIYEACSFQDITGQRISKVVRTLKVIDTKVESLLQALGSPLPGEQGDSGPGYGEEILDPMEKLLNGPQMPEAAISQEDIDRILADFD